MFEIVINDRFRPRRISNFNEFSLNLKWNSTADTFGFSWLFNPDNPDHKNAMCISHFHECQVYYKSELLVNGNLINARFQHDKNRRMASLEGYTRPGILDTVNVPIYSYPIQTKGLSIKAIANRLCNLYSIDVKIDSSVASDMNSTVKDDNIEPTETIKDYLVKICDPKGIKISHTANGEILFTQANVKKEPIFEIDSKDSSRPAYDMTFNFDGQDMHRYITVMQQATESGANGGQYTIRNPYVINTYPKDKIVTAGSGENSDMKEMARQELSKELKMMKLNISLSNWKIGDEMIKPGDIISIIDPYLYLYYKSKFFIMSASYNGNVDGIKCDLECVPLAVFETTAPESMFRGINLHDTKYDNSNSTNPSKK